MMAVDVLDFPADRLVYGWVIRGASDNALDFLVIFNCLQRLNDGKTGTKNHEPPEIGPQGS